MRKIISILITASLLSLCVLGGIITEDTNDIKAIQEFADTYMCENAGVLSEWFALALSDTECDFSKYVSSLEQYISENPPSSVSALKYALVYRALGVENECTAQTAQNLTDDGGVMYIIFALHLLNNGFEAPNVTKEALTQKLTDMQNEDGGWSVIKGNSDVDATAMALQALAADKDTHSDIIEKAVSFISSSQTDTGAFKSYGVENAESISQVIIALSSLGIDCKNDERFIKNTRTPFDALEDFKKSGGYSHDASGDVSDLATSQALCAFVSYDKFTNESKPFYIFDKKTNNTVIPEDTADITDVQVSTADTEKVENNEKESDAFPLWRIILIIAVSLICLILCVLLVLFKKASAANIIVIIFICIAVLTVSFFINLKTPDEYYNDTAESEKITGSVTFCINAESIGKGYVLPSTELPVCDGDTVYDALIRTAKKYELVIGTDGAGDFAYVKSINGISELQYGDLSGWTYKVNGKSPSVGCGSYKLSDGDSIEFIYMKEMRFE